jgi:uncharacterized protein (DUF2236 family)
MSALTQPFDPARPPPEPPALTPDLLEDLLDAVAPFAAATANVIMQLAWLPVGRGVAESRVESGRVDLHPIKRLRTTLSYVLIATYGTEFERLALRDEVNRAHAQVRSRPGDPVAYNAFDPQLQLWVAACIYTGVRDTYVWLHGTADSETLDAIYRHSKRFGTTLQVPEQLWPADRDAFEEYWNAGLERIKMDDVTRRYLTDLAGLRFLPLPLRITLGSVNQLLTGGFLEPCVRNELGLPWTTNHERAFDALTGTVALVNRRLPRIVRKFPLNVYVWDVRRRLHNGRPVV